MWDNIQGPITCNKHTTLQWFCHLYFHPSLAYMFCKEPPFTILFQLAIYSFHSAVGKCTLVNLTTWDEMKGGNCCKVIKINWWLVRKNLASRSESVGLFLWHGFHAGEVTCFKKCLYFHWEHRTMHVIALKRKSILGHTTFHCKKKNFD